MKRWIPCCLFIAACTATPQADTPSQGFEEGPPLVALDGKGDALATNLPAYAALTQDQSTDAIAFEAMFAPDDPVNTVEMEQIARVVAERVADPREFEEGENPFRIRYAVYNLRNPRIVEALADAEDAGVDVQVLLDGDQLDPARTWNVADERLIERGFEFNDDHRQLSAFEFITADLVGIGGSGLMHMKTRLYETPSERWVLSGSLNPGDNAVLNEETLHLIRDRDVVSRYAGAYEAVLHDEDLQNEWDDQAAVNVLFTPASSERAVGHVFDWLAEEDEQILLMMFSLRDLTAPGHTQSLLELLASKVADGVDVFVITDRKQSDGVDSKGNRIMRDDDTEDRLREAGIHVYEATNMATDFTAMHHKAAILGRTNIRVITDAANWTFSGLGSATRRARNIESQLFINSSALDDNRTGRRYLAQWVRVASRYADQNKDNGPPDFDSLWETLSNRDGWPQQAVRFTADETMTEFGQSAFVRGNLNDLGHWGDTSEGHQLTTDEDSYPTWASVTSVIMPVGQQFEYKFTVQFAGSTHVRWENGENRTGFAQPSVFEAPGAHHRGSWQ